MAALSARLAAIVAALPLREGMRVLEIGCGAGAMARAMAARIGDGQVLGIDRSAKAVALAIAGSVDAIAAGRLAFRQSAVEIFERAPGEPPFDLAVAIRVGVLDGRHPAREAEALRRIAAALAPGAALYLDGGDPLRCLTPRGAAV